MFKLILSVANFSAGVSYYYMPSSVVESFTYNPAKKALRIVYTSGAVYDYLGVTEKAFNAMEAAESKGVFLNLEIKPKYPFRKVK